MSILIDRSNRIIVQGITGNEGSFWTQKMIEMGSQVVAGCTPNREGQTCCGVPVYHSVRRAMANQQADTCMIFVPPKFASDAVLEALDAGAKLICTLADGIPLHEMAQIRKAALEKNARVIGANTSGLISPGRAMLGALPYWIDRVYKPGRIGVMTRSGSLTNEVSSMVVKAGFGISTLVGVGGDPIPGTRFAELLPLYEKDEETDAVVLIGELGGTMEEEVAEAMQQSVFTKPLVAFLSGRTAPIGTRMGHAGAIATSGQGTVEGKSRVLKAAGAFVAIRPSDVGDMLRTALEKKYSKL